MSKSRRADNKGRSEGEPRFLQLFFWVMESPAFHHLSPDGRSALLYLAKRYDGRNNGKIGFGVRSGGFVRNAGDPRLIDLPIMSKTRMHNALIEVQAFKLATVTRESTFGQKKLAREWRLNWLRCDGLAPNREFMSLTVAECERIRATLKTKVSPARRTIPPPLVPPAGHGKRSKVANAAIQSRPQDYAAHPQSRPQDTSNNHRLATQMPGEIAA